MNSLWEWVANMITKCIWNQRVPEIGVYILLGCMMIVYIYMCQGNKGIMLLGSLLLIIYERKPMWH